MRICEIRNLDPVMKRQLKEVGIDDAKALEEMGAVEAYCRLRFFGNGTIP